MKTKAKYIKPVILTINIELTEVIAGANTGGNIDIPTNNNSSDGNSARIRARNFWDTEEE